MMNCKICLATSNPLDRATILGKYSIQYFKCPLCGFVQTEAPFWLDDAYSSAITRSDLGLVARNVSSAVLTAGIIATLFRRNAKYVDYGGGYGLLVRLMRDWGYDYYHYDSKCANLFAAGFEADVQSPEGYELLTAYEVFEHLVEPLADIEHMLRFSHSIVFSTLLIPVDTPKLSEWWYYGLDHGQHIAFYTVDSLNVIASYFNLRLYSNGRKTHLLTNKRLSPATFKFCTNGRIAAIVRRLYRRPTLLYRDYHKLTGKWLS